MYLTNLFHSIQIGKRSSSAQKSIEIDSYEVTIFPAETVKNTQTLPALSKMKKQLNSANKGDEPTYHTWFYDLHGGRTEYVITIACMSGRSRSERQNQNAKNISKRAEILSEHWATSFKIWLFLCYVFGALVLALSSSVWLVVYFDQILGVAGTQKLVEILFLAVFNLFCSFTFFQ